jgi:UDP-N-acetyl-D-glucosamine dehydrogenase
MESQPLTAELLEATDAAVLVTDHRSVDYDLVVERSAVVIDTRGVYRNKNGKIKNA